MKKNILYGALIISTCVISGFVFGPSENLMEANKKMMQNMKALPMTGNPDHDFATMIAEHHKGAIEMCQIELQSGKDENTKSMARKMKEAQEKELNQLQAFTEKHKVEGHHDHKEMSKEDPFSKKMMKNMQEMENKMKSMKMTGDVDKDFTKMMIEHHKDGIEMAKAEVAHGKNQEMKSMAQKMIQDQQKDINDLQKLVAKK